MADIGVNNPEKQAAEEKTLTKSDEALTSIDPKSGWEPRFQDIVIDPKYIEEFSNLSETELRKCKALTKSDEVFTFRAGYKNRRKAIRKQHGEKAIQSQPLVSLLYLRVLNSEDESLAIYGTINAEFEDQRGKMVVHQLYKSNEDDAQFVGAESYYHSLFAPNKRGDLMFNGASSSTVRDQTFMPLPPSKRIKVDSKLFQKTGDVFADTSLELDVEIEDDSYGGITYEHITCNEGFEAILWYMVVPFGVTCCIDISVYYRHSTGEGDSLCVSGNIAARYGCRYDEFINMSYLLFDKKGEESETVYNKGGSLKLSRCWVAVPAYSSLLVTMDLSVHQNKAGTEEGQKLAKANFCDTVQLFPEQDWWSDETTVLDDYIITAYAWWYSPDHHWPSITGEDADTQSEEESHDDDGDGVGDDDDDGDGNDHDHESSSFNTILNPYEPLPFLAIQIYSVFIGAEHPSGSALGTIKVVSKDEIICSIYDSDDGARNWTLSERGQLIPVSDGFRVFWKYVPMELKIDIKDDADYLAIKGYGDWETTHSLDTDLGYGKQLCSVIRGKHGFVAVHYSIFSTGLVATIEVILKSKVESDIVDVDSMVRGSLIAQYSHLKYSSKYEKDCYRVVLWRGSGPVWSQTETEKDAHSNDRRIPLARSRIFVPSNSSLLLEVDLSFGELYDSKLSLVKEIAVGKPFEDSDPLNSDYSLCIEVDWQPMKIE